jgi:hypothetical protein
MQADAPPTFPTPENAHLLNKAADCHSAYRLLRTSGISDLVLGVMCLGLALLTLSLGSASVVLLVIGGLLLVTGLWALLAPSPRAMLVDALAMFLFAAVNLFFLVLAYVRRDSGGRVRWWLVLFFLLLLWGGVHRIRRHRRFREASEARPSPETLRWLDAVRARLKASKPEQVPTMIRFDSINAMPPVMCKGELLPDLAVCLINNDQVRFVPKAQLRMEPADASAPIVADKTTKARVVMEGREFNAFAPGESLLRYRAWAEPTYASAPPASPPPPLVPSPGTPGEG